MPFSWKFFVLELRIPALQAGSRPIFKKKSDAILDRSGRVSRDIFGQTAKGRGISTTRISFSRPNRSKAMSRKDQVDLRDGQRRQDCRASDQSRCAISARAARRKVPTAATRTIPLAGP